MTIHSAEALARKAHSMAAKLSKQNARLIAGANQISRAKSSSGSIGASFLAGFKFGSANSGRPKSSIRAKSHEGATSFHFSVTPISRGSIKTTLQAEKSALQSGDGSSTSAVAHQKYIEREAAVELAEQNFHETDQSIDSHLINIDELSSSQVKKPLILMPDDPGYAAAAAEYIDRDSAVEAGAFHKASSFGNIAPTIEERIRFWQAVEESERRPAKHKFTINPGLDEAFWNFVQTDENAPPFLKNIANSNRDAILLTDVKVGDAQNIYQYFTANRTAGPDDSQAIAIEPGRGGRVQTRLVAELPADMTPEQRLEIAKSFCEKEFGQQGVRYHCAIHCPTKANDERNYHMHITFHDRPAERMIHPETGAMVWDFEIIGKKRDISRHYVLARLHQQDKIREFQESKWPPKARKDFAAIVNSVRKKAGKPPIYDPRSYKDMGIYVQPIPSLSREQFHDIQRGIENPKAASKINKRWERMLLKAADEAPVAIPNAAITKRFQELIQNVTLRAPASIVMAKASHGAYLNATRRINEARLDRVALRIAVDKEISGLIPEIGQPKPGAKKAKAELEQLHDYLSNPLHHAEALAVDAQQHAVERLIMLEKQLKAIKPGSLSLPGRDFNMLAGAIGLSHLPMIFQAQAKQAKPPEPVAPKTFTLPEWMRSPSLPEVVAPQKEQAAPTVAPVTTPPAKPVEPAPARREWIDPLLSWKTSPARPPQQPVTAPPPIQTTAPAPASPARASYPAPLRSPDIPAATIVPKVAQNPAAPPPNRQERPATPTAPARPATSIIPATPARPASKSTTTPLPAKSIIPATPNTSTPPLATPRPLSDKTDIERGLEAARAAIASPTPTPSIADKLFPKDSFSKTIPEKPILEKAPQNPDISKTAILPLDPLIVEKERKEKEQRDKRRAILTNPKPPLRKPSNGHER